MMEIFLICMMFLISVVAGGCWVGMIMYTPSESFVDFGKQCLYSIGLYFGLKLIILVICLILNRAFKCGYDSEERKVFSKIYLIVSFVGMMIYGYVEYKSVFSAIMGAVIAILYDGFPILCECLGVTDGDYHSNDVKLNNSSDKYDIKSGYVTDQFGNIKAKSTTYIDGDIKKTYVTDNLGNTIAESTTIGNHTTTKIK